MKRITAEQKRNNTTLLLATLAGTEKEWETLWSLLYPVLGVSTLDVSAPVRTAIWDIDSVLRKACESVLNRDMLIARIEEMRKEMFANREVAK